MLLFNPLGVPPVSERRDNRKMADMLEKMKIVKKDRDDDLLKDLNDAIKKLQDNGKLAELAKKYGLEEWVIK